ncbi:uncharacterized protein LOC141720448 isoform X2 [Apium graveolens]|uniref:uncharacterized protein LOC141720448 isoform X2 n=1 Tax=Apium graveolens TaxID=4045 RepID=UPI003D7BAFE2
MPKSSLCQGMNVQGNDKGISLLRSRNKFFQILIQVNTRSDPDVKDASIDRDTDLLIFANDRLWKVYSQFVATLHHFQVARDAVKLVTK